jgi:hypothetical protein
MTVKSGMEAEIDTILRRSNFKIREGLAGKIDHRALWDRAVSAEEAGIVPSRNGAVRARGADGSRSVAFGVPLVPDLQLAVQASAPQEVRTTDRPRIG